MSTLELSQECETGLTLTAENQCDKPRQGINKQKINLTGSSQHMQKKYVSKSHTPS